MLLLWNLRWDVNLKNRKHLYTLPHQYVMVSNYFLVNHFQNIGVLFNRYPLITYIADRFLFVHYT